MSSGRRLAVLLLICALVGVPAATLRALCSSCGVVAADASGPVPFCSLPAQTRRAIAAGFRGGRSPDVLAVTAARSVTSGEGSARTAWPRAAGGLDARVPLVLWGVGIRPGALPAGTGLAQVAPTLEGVLAVPRPHPEDRSGVAVPRVAGGEHPGLVIEIAWKGVGAPDLEARPAAWPFLRSVLRSGEAADTLAASPGSLPLDPAATLTTIGTGALPSEHGITGSLVRGDDGEVVGAWTRRAPPPVVPTLGDDLDHALGERPRIGLVAPDASDRGIVGGTWYLDADRDDVVVGARDPVAEVARLLASGYGSDEVPDLLAVVVTGPVAEADRTTRAIVRLADRLALDAAFVVTATGARPPRPSIGAGRVVAAVERAVEGRVVADEVAGGLFLDQRTLGRLGVAPGGVVEALEAMRAPDGEPVFADVFPGFAVSFGRYC